MDGFGCSDEITCSHPDVMRPFCLNCGVKESVLSDELLVTTYSILDKHLSQIGKIRSPIKRDGHCLPRAVFKGLKRKGQLQEFLTYKHLFRAVVQHIHDNIDTLYMPWLSNNKEDTIKQVDLYESKKQYTSNVVDIFLKALANVTLSAIIAYYVDSNSVSSHSFCPTSTNESMASVEISFVGGHYDLIIDKGNPTSYLRNDCHNSDGAIVLNIQENVKVEFKTEIPLPLKSSFPKPEQCTIIIDSDEERVASNDENNELLQENIDIQVEQPTFSISSSYYEEIDDFCELTNNTMPETINSSIPPTAFFGEYPVLTSCSKKRISATEAASILLNPTINPDLICQSVPVRVQQNLAFIVNLHALDSCLDVTADDNGATRGGQGRKSHIYCKTSETCIESLRVTTDQVIRDDDEDYFLLTKYNSIYESSRDFHRCIIKLQPDAGTEKFFQYCIVQYLFDKEEHEFEVMPHRNARRRPVPYKQTARSVRDNLRNALTNNSPNEALHSVSNFSGGYLAAKSSSSLPRNYRQAINMKTSARTGKSYDSTKNTLADLMEQCKKTMNNPSKAFIWKVEAAPEPMCIIGTENSFTELIRSCCNTTQGKHSVLCIDPTFNLGDFFFTPTSFNSQSILRSSTGKNVLFMGPSLIHYRKKFSSYHYFTTSLININPQLHGLRCYGTDGEDNLVQACEKTWPLADSLRCFLHSRKNCKSHLCTYLPAAVADSFVNDIFGDTIGTHHQEGLCDLENGDIFEAVVDSLQEEWMEMETPYRGSSCTAPFFHEWFQNNVTSYMRKSMLKDVRMRNGISGTFTTNTSESLNAALKRKTNYHALELQTFLKTMKEFYQNQDDYVRSAFLGDGDFILSEPFMEEFYVGETYYTLTAEQRVKHEEKFFKAIPVDSGSERVKTLNPRVVNMRNTTGINLIQGLDPKHSFNIIQKADRIINSGLIIPSFVKGSYHVRNTSEGDEIHFVKQIKPGEYKCDPDDPRNGCTSFKKNRICSHVIAASKSTGDFEVLVRKFGTSKNTNSIEDLAMHGIPYGAGKKPGRRRKRANQVPVETVSRATERFNDVTQTGENVFRLELLGDHPKVNVCAGCNIRFPRKPDKKPYPPPDDLIISHPEQGSKRMESGVLKVFNKVSKRYYHINISCVRNGNNGLNKDFSGSDLDYNTINERLTNEHKKSLKDNLFLEL